MDLNTRLREHAHRIAAQTAMAACPEFDRPVRRLRWAALRVGQAWSGAWLPGLANLYTETLEPLAVAQEGGSRVVEWKPQSIRQAIHHAAGSPDLVQLLGHATRVREWLDGARVRTRLLLTEVLANHPDDPVLTQLCAELEHAWPDEPELLLQAWRPVRRARGRSQAVASMSELLPAVAQARSVPPHLRELAAVEAIRSPLTALYALSSLTRRAADRHDVLQQREAARDFQVTLPLLHRLGYSGVSPQPDLA